MILRTKSRQKSTEMSCPDDECLFLHLPEQIKIDTNDLFFDCHKLRLQPKLKIIN